MRRGEGALDNGSALSRFAQIRSHNQTRVGLVSSPGFFTWFLHLVSSPRSPGLFTWFLHLGKDGRKFVLHENDQKYFCTSGPAVCEIFVSLRMITYEGLAELTQCPLEGRLSVVCGRYELSLRICTGRGFTVTIVTPAAWSLHNY